MRCLLFLFTAIVTSAQLSFMAPAKEYNGSEQAGLNFATETLSAIASKDYNALSDYIHPEKGVIFAPESYIDYNEHLVFTPEQIKASDNSTRIYNWGSDGPSPYSIELTIDEYFDLYVYNKDYLNTKEIAVNNIILQGNSIINIMEVFPESTFVDFHDPGTAEYEGLDWSSLTIVMERYQGDYKIVAIIHSGYTL